MKDGEYRVKKLALAFHTGWEYLPGEREAGSVLTDIFLEMMEDNWERYRKIWEKQERSFLRVAPIGDGAAGLLKTALCVRADGGADGEELSGEILPKGTVARRTGIYTPWGEDLLWFVPAAPLRLTAASPKYALYQRGGFVWLVWEGEGRIPMFRPSGRLLEYPVYRWRFRNLCNGLDKIRFPVRPEGNPERGRTAGRWSITDSRHIYPLEWQENPDGWTICGETPEYAGNLQDTEYEIIWELPCGEESGDGPKEGVPAFAGGLSLREPELSLRPDICLTDRGAEDGSRILPFGSSPDGASCCYLACDAVLAGRRTRITLKFKESFLVEEELPPRKPEGYEKYYKKYPWLAQGEEVRDWKVSESVWEYFDGEMWRALTGGRATGRVEPEGIPVRAEERVLCWDRPEDMEPCSIEGCEHFYLRLRAAEVAGAYAAYYRKYIPVMEDIRFAAQEYVWECAGQAAPEMSRWQERMYLGFDRAVTPQNRWYAEYQGPKGRAGAGVSFGGGQLAGRGRRFGLDAFWVELAPGWPEDAPGLSCGGDMELTANYTELLQVPDVREAIGTERLEIPRGTKFYMETDKAGTLEGITVTDAYYDGTGAPFRTGVRAAENFFFRQERLVTPMDVKTLFGERYPRVRVESCRFAEDINELVVTVGEYPRDGGGLREIQEWLEEEIRRSGSLWLAACGVRIRTLRRGEETDAGGNEAG